MTLDVRVVELPNKATLPYVEKGDPGGIPVLLVHAVGDSRRAFEPLLNHLPDSMRAIAFSQRGHGDAGRPDAGYRPEDFAADLIGFMDALEIDAAVLVGGSSGGFVVRHAAMSAPARVLALAFLGSPAMLGDKPGALALWETTFSKLKDPIDADFARDFVESTLARPVSPDFLETLVQESLKVPAAVWRATIRGLLEDDSLRDLHQITTPALVVWGEKDAILPRSDQEALAGAIPGARLVVHPGAGHAFYLEDPRRTASDLVAFIDGLGVQRHHVIPPES